MWIKGKPDKSGNYAVRYNGREGRDDYTTSSGGHWWNTGSIHDQDKVEYDPDSFRDLGLQRTYSQKSIKTGEVYVRFL